VHHVDRKDAKEGHERAEAEAARVVHRPLGEGEFTLHEVVALGETARGLPRSAPRLRVITTTGKKGPAAAVLPLRPTTYSPAARASRVVMSWFWEKPTNCTGAPQHGEQCNAARSHRTLGAPVGTIARRSAARSRPELRVDAREGCWLGTSPGPAADQRQQRDCGEFAMRGTSSLANMAPSQSRRVDPPNN
jgi:hypothetical protein